MLSIFMLAAGLGLVPKLGPTPLPVTLTTRDGVTLYADTYVANSPAAPVVLLFHQADSGKGEYAPLGPRLALAGFNAIAIDQRAGGAMYGTNLTAAALRKPATALDALADLEASLAWAKRTHPQSKIVAVGSSYSASLVFALAAKHPHDVAAVAAFSPGEYFANKHYVEAAARNVHVPVFIDSGTDPEELANARTIYAAVGSRDKFEFMPKAGIHGASTMRDDRDPEGATENFNAFMAFLQRVTRR